MDNSNRSDSFGRPQDSQSAAGTSGYRFDGSHSTPNMPHASSGMPQQQAGLGQGSSAIGSGSTGLNASSGVVGELSKDKLREVLVRANDLYQRRVDWLTFFREILGVGGVARTMFPSQQEFLAFEQTSEFSRVERMMHTLRTEKVNPKPNREATKVITVRLPESIHEALRAEASDHRTSINKLCISKLLQALNEETLPSPNPPARQASMGQNPSGSAPSSQDSSRMEGGSMRTEMSAAREVPSTSNAFGQGGSHPGGF